MRGLRAHKWGGRVVESGGVVCREGGGGAGTPALLYPPLPAPLSLTPTTTLSPAAMPLSPKAPAPAPQSSKSAGPRGSAPRVSAASACPCRGTGSRRAPTWTSGTRAHAHPRGGLAPAGWVLQGGMEAGDRGKRAARGVDPSPLGALAALLTWLAHPSPMLNARQECSDTSMSSRSSEGGSDIPKVLSITAPIREAARGAGG